MAVWCTIFGNSIWHDGIEDQKLWVCSQAGACLKKAYGLVNVESGCVGLRLYKSSFLLICWMLLTLTVSCKYG
jgi:hypothetical protein